MSHSLYCKNLGNERGGGGVSVYQQYCLFVSTFYFLSLVVPASGGTRVLLSFWAVVLAALSALVLIQVMT